MSAFDPEFDARVIHLYSVSKLPPKVISEMLPISRSGIYKVLDRYDIPRIRSRGGVKGNYKISDDEAKLTIYLYRDQGLSLKEVGEILGIHDGTVKARLLRRGVKLRSRSEGIAIANAKKTAAEQRARGLKAAAKVPRELQRETGRRGGLARAARAAQIKKEQAA